MLELFAWIGVLELFLDVPIPPGNPPPMLPTAAVAITAELMDPIEFAVPEPNKVRLLVNLECLHLRRKELKDAPYVYAAYSFPPRPVAVECWRFNRAYAAYLENLSDIYGLYRPDLYPLLTLTNQLGEIWELVVDAQHDYYFVTTRRATLLRLKNRLGEEAFRKGELPPHVPIWAFHYEP